MNAFASTNKGYKLSNDGKWWDIGNIDGNTSLINAGGNKIVASKKYLLYIDLKTRLFTPQEIDKKVLLVINKIVAPYTFEKLFGMNTNLYDIIGDAATFKNADPNIFVIGTEETYQINKFTSLINWKEDCNMQPIGPMKVQELLGSDEIPDFPLFDFNSITNTQTLNSLIKKVKIYLEKIKENFINDTNTKIDAIILDDRFIIQGITTQEEINNALDMKQMFATALKDGSKAIFQDYVRKCYVFDEPMIKRILISTVYEMMQKAATQLKYNFTMANQRIAYTNIDYMIDMNTYPLVLDFNRNLNLALKKYFHAMSKNVEILNTENDRDIIKFASERFKFIERNSLAAQASELLHKIDISPNDIINIEVDIERFKLATKNYIETIKDEVIETRKRMLNTFFEQYLFAYYERNNYIKQILLMINDSYNNIMNRFDLSTLKYTGISSWDELNTLQNDKDKQKVYKYMYEILNKYKYRCKELIYVIYSSFTETIKKERADIIYQNICKYNNVSLNVFKNNIIDEISKNNIVDINIINKIIDNYNGFLLKQNIIKEINNFMSTIVNEFDNRKGVI